MAKYMMALDAGTTSNRCILFNEKGEICSVAQEEFTQYYPQPGWVEHDPAAILNTQVDSLREVVRISGIPVEQIARRVEAELSDVTVPLKVAVMGCIVNGLGEGREADVGIAGGKDGGALFVKGEKPRAVKGDLAEALIAEIRKRVSQ